MPKEQETKIVPSLPVKKTEAEVKRPNYVPWLIALIGVYFALMLMISFLPLSGYMKVLSLFFGTFLIFDIHHSIKYHVRTK